MHKFGLLLILANIILKLALGIGLWKMAMDFKSNNNIGMKNPNNYDEEVIERGEPGI